MTVQSLKIIGQSNLDLEFTQALKIGGGDLGNKIVLEIVSIDPKQTQKT